MVLPVEYSPLLEQIMTLPFSAFRIFVICVPLLTGSITASHASNGLLFYVSADHKDHADYAAGNAEPIFSQGVTRIPDGKTGAGLSFSDNLVLAWSGPGNIYAQRGTISFFFRSHKPYGTTPFPIFRVGSSDGSSWDMVFLRIDWNGHGYDAFVTDTGLARTRISYRIATIPADSDWTHIAFAWDERSGIKLWINGKSAATLNHKAIYDSGLFGFGPFQRVVSPWQVHTRRMYGHGGDLDEIRIYDHMLDDQSVAVLAASAMPSPTNTSTFSAKAVQQNWWQRYGWNHTDITHSYLSAPHTRIRKV